MNAWRLLSTASFLLMAVLPLQAAQAAIIYAFETFTRGLGAPYSASFSYTAPDFIVSNTLIPTPRNCVVTIPSPSTCGPTQQFYADSTLLAGSDAYDAVEFSPAPSNYYYYYFEDGAFSAFGVYDTVILGTDQAARLTISASTVEPIPEPASWLMMMAGFLVLGSAMRLRRATLGSCIRTDSQ